MGAGTVKAVYALWGDLPDGAFRLLAYMANASLDEASPPRFYGGRESMAFALGWVVADAGTEDPDAIALRERAFKSVNRLVGVLRKAGAIVQTRVAAPGRNAEYALNLRAQRSLETWDRSRPRSQVKGDHSGPSKAPAEGPKPGNGPKLFGGTVPSYSAERSPFIRQTVPSERGPEEYQEPDRTRGEEEVADVDLTSHRPRATAEPTNPDPPPAPAKCPDGLSPALRADGKPECPICRRRADRPGILAPPPPDEGLAPVIPLPTRRAS
jgi:hypothetical protein